MKQGSFLKLMGTFTKFWGAAVAGAKRRISFCADGYAR
jgi:hypothetical protein